MKQEVEVVLRKERARHLMWLKICLACSFALTFSVGTSISSQWKCSQNPSAWSNHRASTLLWSGKPKSRWINSSKMVATWRSSNTSKRDKNLIRTRKNETRCFVTGSLSWSTRMTRTTMRLTRTHSSPVNLRWLSLILLRQKESLRKQGTLFKCSSINTSRLLSPHHWKTLKTLASKKWFPRKDKQKRSPRVDLIEY